jgi:hypothetical protein
MVRVAVGAVTLAILLAAGPAWSDEAPVAQSPQPASPLTTAPSTDVPAPADESSDWASVLGVFDALVNHYVELMEFTKRIEAEREERAFEEAAAEYARFDAFTRALAAQHEQELEQEFDTSVALYVRKRLFTEELVADRKRAAGTQVEPSR